MSQAIKNLTDLLFPHDPLELEHAIVHNRRMHLRTQRADAFQALLPWGVVGDLVTIDHVLAGRTRVITNGRDLPLEMFTRLDVGKKRREIVPGAFQELCTKGVSLIINGIDSLVPRIAATTAMLERQLNVRSGVNAYVSFRRSGAFRPHWDGHHLLVMQLYGRKRWQCFRPVESLPVAGRQFDNLAKLGEPEWDDVLESGDVLYIPRGVIHSGAVIDPHSLHLTIHIIPSRGIDFAHWLANRAEEFEEFRKDISTLAGSQPMRDQHSEIKNSLYKLIETFNLDDFLSDQAHWETPYQPINLGLEDCVNQDTWIRPTLRHAIDLPKGQIHKLEIGKLSVELSADECAVLSALLSQHSIQYKNILDLFPDMTSDIIAKIIRSLSSKSLIFILD